jgi:hypothetical protein
MHLFTPSVMDLLLAVVQLANDRQILSALGRDAIAHTSLYLSLAPRGVAS